MNRTIYTNKQLFLLGIPVLMILTLISLANSQVFKDNSDTLSLYITLDLLLLIPMVYFLTIRKTTIPKYTILLASVAGVIIASQILPIEHQHYLGLLKKWGLPVIEISIISFVVYKFRKILKKYRQQNVLTPDFYTSLKKICNEILPSIIVSPIASEIALTYYGLIDWKRKKVNDNEFTYHKNSGSLALFGTLIFLMTVESISIHVHLVKNGDPRTAWILTAVTTYNAFQVFGFIKSIIKRPISIRDNTLILHYGIMNETCIDIRNIESVELSTAQITFDKHTRSLSPLGELESHNVVITLKDVNTQKWIFGIKRKYTTLALHVDQKEAFKNKIEETIQTIKAKNCDY
ncbi:hypothetical protein [Aquimarina sp. 2304DJ70-9]|uniref:hypothetical protein n=1 Tax=Aquimarina penaris TaxID=3231044 RepID=UPI003463244C